MTELKQPMAATGKGIHDKGRLSIPPSASLPVPDSQDQAKLFVLCSCCSHAQVISRINVLGGAVLVCFLLEPTPPTLLGRIASLRHMRGGNKPLVNVRSERT